MFIKCEFILNTTQYIPVYFGVRLQQIITLSGNCLNPWLDLQRFSHRWVLLSILINSNL